MNEGMDNLKEIEDLKKEIALVREDAQVTQLSLEKRISELDAINKQHQKLNGELRKEYDALKKANQNLRTIVEDYQNKASHYRRKGVL